MQHAAIVGDEERDVTHHRVDIERRGLAYQVDSARHLLGKSLGAPELEAGDKTKLQPGMTFAGDGGLSVAGRFGARVGDSIAVTAEEGFEYLTPYPKKLTVI